MQESKYVRLLPHDLGKEAALLKCLASIDRQLKEEYPKNCSLEFDDSELAHFNVEMNADLDIFVTNMRLRIYSNSFKVFRPWSQSHIQAAEEWSVVIDTPIYGDDSPYRLAVLDTEGILSAEFKAWVEDRNPEPYPNEPERIANLSKLSRLRHQGFEGADANLEEALNCYGLAWKKLAAPVGDDDYLFVYAIHNPTRPQQFDRCLMRSSTTTFEQFNVGDVTGSSGLDLKDWEAAEFSLKIAMLHAYYGYENVFGTSYFTGFNIEGLNDD